MKMKLKNFAWAVLALPMAYSCSQGGNKQTGDTGVKAAADTLKQCYTSVFEGDSATMDIKIIDSTKVEGKLVIKYAEKPHNNGIVRGEFKGDTLLVDYTFKTGQNPTEFSNPLAFLKQGGHLKMGVGVIETTLGRSYFAKDKPINFEKGKFDFAPAECK
ncbi:hypothetical protein [Pedobacter nanyangensis]|uniref:hypothetical protein n=1 Tax=Pedobacter nanyangensis TaxID=1562389 RepID=UPI001F06A60E|nr:hypothetical protein [Pedobacter nanyangensis]